MIKDINFDKNDDFVNDSENEKEEDIVYVITDDSNPPYFYQGAFIWSKKYIDAIIFYKHKDAVSIANKVAKKQKKSLFVVENFGDDNEKIASIIYWNQ